MKKLHAFALLATTALHMTFAADHTVTSGADSGAGTLRALYNSAGAGDRILIPAGMTVTLTGVLDTTKKISIVGVGAREACVITGAGTHRLLTFTGGNTITNMLENLTISNGWTSANNASGAVGTGSSLSRLFISNCVFRANTGTTGGALRTGANLIVVRDTVFEGNRAMQTSDSDTGYGGAVWMNHPIEFYNCSFTNNFADPGRRGGAVYGHDSTANSAYFNNCNFVSNFVASVNSGATYGMGGVMYNFRMGFTMEDCHFEANSSEAGNGGVFFLADPRPQIGKAVLKRCVFRNNIGGAGGCISTTWTDVTVEDCVFEGSLSRPWRAASNNELGAVVYQNGGNSTTLFQRCVFRDNIATNWPERSLASGWCGVASAFQIKFHDCLFENNTAQGNVATVKVRGVSEFVNCTFTGNSANEDVVQVDMQNNAHTALFANCTFTENTVRTARGVITDVSDNSRVSLVNCTIVSNTLPNNANGFGVLTVYVPSANSKSSMQNCVVAENRRVSTSGFYDVNRGFIVMENSVLSQQDSQYSASSFDAPRVKVVWSATPAQTKLNGLADNDIKWQFWDGAKLLTMSFNPGSILRNTGAPVPSITTDARGFPRPDKATNLTDIGAYELFIPFSTLLMVR